MFVHFPVENISMIMFYSVLISAWLSINSLFILMKKIFIYRTINVWQPFLNLGSVAFLTFYLKLIEIIPMTALELFFNPLNSFKTLNYCRDAN